MSIPDTDVKSMCGHFPCAEGQTTISVVGGEQPCWRGDGEELFFVAADEKVMAVPVKASAGAKPAFGAGATVASV